ncbi:bacillithiol biosynthesis cysteine-adding enzyme BshC [Tunturibacter empetritectus]|uniref:Putative cysteine ligase BshC n=1 Tax=Tunturiibacter empetritectus TaxID=3069691 RepID=A0A7W8MT59_9BACT|nr:bacillithiol biosynthesis cysteine-adding enzyme BshC [Edaphobacter lichenicola]MBB5317849.1 bacillithiol biosynthesis cysteine-adding enzyme BshC [Edaphobacter lichenicola]
MSVECFPITVLPHVSQIYRDYLAMAESAGDSAIRRWYGAEPFTGRWIGRGEPVKDAGALADLLEKQAVEFGAGDAAKANIAKLRAGARAVVTGQQVVLFGGPLLTILKAATAVARAKEATKATGVEHVPVFWMATEDHDLEEVDQVSLLTKSSVETLRAGLKVARAVPVGGVVPGPELEAVLERASELLEFAPVSEWLRECYGPEGGRRPSLALAFGRLMAKIFAEQGLVVMDAASREFHALGASTLRYAIEHAAELQDALIARGEELVARGYHAQVLVAEGGSMLFLLDEATGERVALRRSASVDGDAQWKAGGRSYSTAELIAILETTPERLSPNALLRPVFQDTLLPTAAYVGGPAEIAYFAQSAVLYEAIFGMGRITPVLPRLSATLLEPAIATVMDKDEVQLPDAMTTAEALAQRLGARAMPIEGKRKIAAVGNAVETELNALTEYLAGMDESLGRSAEVSGSKMRYQMNRLRRMAATFELQKEASLRKHAEAIVLNVFPGGHPQERVVAGVWFMARYGDGLVEKLVGVAGNQCPGHVVVRL